jgi:WXG100 family type VII secretion target
MGGSKDLDVTYDDMRKAAKHMERQKERINDKLQDLKSYIDNLVETGYVTRKSSKKFQEDFDEFKKGMEKTSEGLQGLSKYLDMAADKFEQIDEDLAKGGKG